MTREFRYAILSADDKIDEKFVKIEKKGQSFVIDDNILHQIQRMFSFLELSDR
jgi:ubiquitin carboxyl-terminal hydrolase 34